MESRGIQRAPYAGEAVTNTKTDAKIAATLAEIPQSMQATYQKAMSGRSRSSAIKAMCQRCMGWEDAVKFIRQCESVTCPLHPYRPYQGRNEAK